MTKKQQQQEEDEKQQSSSTTTSDVAADVAAEPKQLSLEMKCSELVVSLSPSDAAVAAASAAAHDHNATDNPRKNK